MSTTRAQDSVGFPDVPKDHWAYHAVTHLKSLGILKGYPPASARVARDRDHAVLESVLAGLRKDSPADYIYMRFRTGGIVFDRTTVRTKITPSAILDEIYGGYSDPPARPPASDQRTAVAEAAQDLVRRIDSPGSFAEYTPGHRGITLYRKRTVRYRDEQEERKAVVDQYIDQPVSVWLPGYSRDGRTAIVCLSIPVDLHGAMVTVLLTKEDGDWKVIRRYFVYRG
jgi:hypothetical protein